MGSIVNESVAGRGFQAALLMLFAVIAVVLAVVLSGGKHNSNTSVGTLPTAGSLTGALPGAADAAALLHGIPQTRLTLGSPSAPLTMTEYIDPQCPYCQQF